MLSKNMVKQQFFCEIAPKKCLYCWILSKKVYYSHPLAFGRIFTHGGGEPRARLLPPPSALLPPGPPAPGTDRRNPDWDFEIVNHFMSDTNIVERQTGIRFTNTTVCVPGPVRECGLNRIFNICILFLMPGFVWSALFRSHTSRADGSSADCKIVLQVVNIIRRNKSLTHRTFSANGSDLSTPGFKL